MDCASTTSAILSPFIVRPYAAIFCCLMALLFLCLPSSSSRCSFDREVSGTYRCQRCRGSQCKPLGRVPTARPSRGTTMAGRIMTLADPAQPPAAPACCRCRCVESGQRLHPVQRIDLVAYFVIHSPSNTCGNDSALGCCARHRRILDAAFNSACL